MAQVSISVADITVGIEDEDESAKSLKKLALCAIADLVEVFGIHPPEKGDDEEEGSGGSH